MDPDDLFNRINKYADVFRNGGCPRECTSCYKIEEKEWPEERYIDQITISHFSNCNVDCVYCSNGLEKWERTNDTYKVAPVLKALKDQGILKQGCELHMGGGEFTIYEECDELLEIFGISNFARVFVATSCAKYSHNLFRAMDEGTTFICVSLDCGSKETYKKIKRVDAFDKVIENLEKYAKTDISRERIRLKYIIIPSLNDNIEEYKKFLQIAKRIGVSTVIVDIEGRYSRLKNYKIDDYFINLAHEMNELAIQQGFATEFYCFFAQNAHEQNIKKGNKISNMIKRLKFKYFDSEIKKLYTDHKYGT